MRPPRYILCVSAAIATCSLSLSAQAASAAAPAQILPPAEDPSQDPFQASSNVTQAETVALSPAVTMPANPRFEQSPFKPSQTNSQAVLAAANPLATGPGQALSAPAQSTQAPEASSPPAPLLAESLLDQVLEEALTDDFLTPADPPPPLDPAVLESEVGELKGLPQSSRQSPRQSPQTGSRPSAQAGAPAVPTAQLLLRASAFTSSNVTASDLDSTGDGVFVNQATLLVTPQLGPDTRVIATVGGSLTRFANEGAGNTDALNLSLGIQQRLGAGMYGQLGWLQDRLYNSDDGDRSLLDNSLRLLIGRQDQLDRKLRLDTSYELRARFTDPRDRSRIGNSLGTRLRYSFSPDWQATLGYQLSLNDYTRNGRFDSTHQIQATTTYTPSKETFITGYASYLFGNSSEASIDLDNLSFGLGIGLNLPLF